MPLNVTNMALTLLYDALKELYGLSAKMKENNKECVQLVEHVNMVYTRIVERYGFGTCRVPNDLCHNLNLLAEYVS